MSRKPAPTPIPSATVVLLRAGNAGLEVLLLQRSSRIPDRPGSWVFPGGRIDEDDFVRAGVAMQQAAPDSLIESVARQAAVRETAEEAGLALEPEHLRPISRWITPRESPFKRFDTLFFVAHLETDAEVRVDGGEIASHRWIPPEEALSCHRDERSDIALPPPTFVTLHWLLEHDDPRDAVTALQADPILTFRPQIHAREEGACILYPLDAGYEDRNPDAPGPRHRLWTSKSGYEYERLDC